MWRRVWAFALRSTGGLTARLAVLMSMALLPLGAISIHSTLEMQRAAERAAERSLITLAADAVAGKRALIESALASAQELAPQVLKAQPDLVACSALLRDYVERSNIYSFAGFIDREGVMACGSQGEPVDFGDSEIWKQLRAAPLTTINSNPAGAATGVPVIIVTRPVFDERELVGFLSISITQRTLEGITQRRIENVPQVAVLLNHDGIVLNLPEEHAARARLPGTEALSDMASDTRSRVLRAETREGEPVVLALAELVPDRLQALGVWEKDAPGLDALNISPVPLLFPAAMWLACLAVVLLSVHYLVLRHLKYLNRQMRQFALGQREDWGALPGHVAAELRELNGTFRNMAALIARDEQERERALAEKVVLLKEIHHRVKNNLQLIASVINLQLRKLRDPAARDVLRNVHERVLGLASVHRALYAEDRLSRVRADRVIEELVGRVAGMGASPGRSPELRLELAPLALNADQMVPLSFLLHEALANALKHLVAAPAGQRWIAVDLSQESTPDGDAVVLRVRNPILDPGHDAAEERAGGLGAELIDAFAQQLGGHCRQEHVDSDGGGLWVLDLRFPAEVDAAPDDPSPAATSGV